MTRARQPVHARHGKRLSFKALGLFLGATTGFSYLYGSAGDIAEWNLPKGSGHNQTPTKNSHRDLGRIPPAPVPKGAKSWEDVARQLQRPGFPRYVIVDAKNGLGNRLRALCSTMSVAASLRRPVLLIWVRDVHCNCSFTDLFRGPLPFEVLDEEIPPANLTDPLLFQRYNYMRPEVGALKDEEIVPDGKRHLYFKSGFLMNHYRGQWRFAMRYLQPPQLPRPVASVERHLVANRTMVGLHVRNVFDVPRDVVTASDAKGAAARNGANVEYGKVAAEKLMQWRTASHWTNFVSHMQHMQAEHARHFPPSETPPLRFYLAADSLEAYDGLRAKFGDALVSTQRPCASAGRCDFRDCASLRYSLADLINLARTRLILGPGYSSFSEVATRMGGNFQRALTIQLAGRDFGGERILMPKRHRPSWAMDRQRVGIADALPARTLEVVS